MSSSELSAASSSTTSPRETWAVERLGDESEHDKDLIRVGPSVTQLELRNKNANGRERPPTQFVTFSFFRDGSIEVNDGRPAGRALADIAADVLIEGPMTLARIVAAIREDTGERVSEDVLRRTPDARAGTVQARRREAAAAVALSGENGTTAYP